MYNPSHAHSPCTTCESKPSQTHRELFLKVADAVVVSDRLNTQMLKAEVITSAVIEYMEQQRPYVPSLED